MKLPMNRLNLATRGRASVLQLTTDREAGCNACSMTLTITTEQKERIKTTRTDAISKNNIFKTRNTSNKRKRKITKELREKPVYYIKTDKRN